MVDKIFANGLFFKRPNDKAPEFIKGSLSIRVEEFIKFLNDNSNNGWVNVDLKESTKGELYFELNTWKPDKEKFVKKDGKLVTEKREDEEIDIEEPENVPF